MKHRMGYEGRVWYGPPGSTGTTLIEDERESTENIEVEKGDTTRKGPTIAPAIKTEDVTVLGYQLELNILNDTDSPVLEDFKVAAATGAGLAIRCKDYANGKGFNGDMTFSASKPRPINGEQVITFTGTPTLRYGRDPQLYV